MKFFKKNKEERSSPEIEENSLKPQDRKELSYSEKLDEERNFSEEKYLNKSIRRVHTDLWFKSKNINNANFSNTLFTRLVASKETKFINVDFSYCIFDHNYIRGCSFDNCNFTGAKFLNTNLQGSSFIGCDFRYAFFEKTLIDDDFIFNNLPRESNLRQKTFTFTSYEFLAIR